MCIRDRYRAIELNSWWTLWLTHTVLIGDEGTDAHRWLIVSDWLRVRVVLGLKVV